MTNSLLPFDFTRLDGELVSVRTIVREGEPWFVLADVCSVLGLAHTGRAAARIDPEDKGVLPTHTPSGTQSMSVINESGLWSLVLRSDKPEAKRFKRWITSEVIPAIRKTGGYVASTPQDTPEIIMARALLVAKEAIERLETQVATATAETELMRPGYDTFRATMDAGANIPIQTLARSLRGVNISAFSSDLAARGWIHRSAEKGNPWRITRSKRGASLLFAEKVNQKFQNGVLVRVESKILATPLGQLQIANHYNAGGFTRIKTPQARSACL